MTRLTKEEMISAVGADADTVRSNLAHECKRAGIDEEGFRETSNLMSTIAFCLTDSLFAISPVDLVMVEKGELVQIQLPKLVLEAFQKVAKVAEISGTTDHVRGDVNSFAIASIILYFLQLFAKFKAEARHEELMEMETEGNS